MKSQISALKASNLMLEQNENVLRIPKKQNKNELNERDNHGQREVNTFTMSLDFQLQEEKKSFNEKWWHFTIE